MSYQSHTCRCRCSPSAVTSLYLWQSQSAGHRHLRQLLGADRHQIISDCGARVVCCELLSTKLRQRGGKPPAIASIPPDALKTGCSPHSHGHRELASICCLQFVFQSQCMSLQNSVCIYPGYILIMSHYYHDPRILRDCEPN